MKIWIIIQKRAVAEKSFLVIQLFQFQCLSLFFSTKNPTYFLYSHSPRIIIWLVLPVFIFVCFVFVGDYASHWAEFPVQSHHWSSPCLFIVLNAGPHPVLICVLSVKSFSIKCEKSHPQNCSLVVLFGSQRLWVWETFIMP